MGFRVKNLVLSAATNMKWLLASEKSEIYFIRERDDFGACTGGLIG